MRTLLSIYLFLAGFLFSGINAYAQTHSTWADSLFHLLKTGEQVSFTQKIKLCDTLLAYYKRNGEHCKRLEVLLFKSDYQTLTGNTKAALNLINEANSRYNKKACKDESLLPKIHLSYTLLYTRLNEYGKAKVYIDKGIASWRESYTDKGVLIQLYSFKGVVSPNIDSQIYYHQLAYNLAVKIKDIKWQEITINDLGCSYAEKEEFEPAKQCFEKALVLAHQRKSYSNISGYFNNLAGLTDDNTLASRYLDSALYYAKLKGNLEDIQTAYQNLALFNYNNGSFKNGYDMLWKSMGIKDSMYNRDKIKAFADMEQKYQSDLKEQQIALLNAQNENKTRQRNGLILGTVLLLAFSVAVVIQRNKVKNEKKRSDHLLLNILPAEVAEELKKTGGSVAKQYNDVTVLFTDFVNFTGISETMSPTELVAEIHENFKAFDRIIERNGLEKIKTIGDAYLAVCGLPHEHSDHAIKVTKAALEIIDWMAKNNAKFQVRIGLNSGPVVAGIVGVKKYAYDIWGDTVNTASRMESSSEPGKINISQTTYELIQREFNCTYRGKIVAKNKGEMDMYFVDRYAEGGK